MEGDRDLYKESVPVPMTKKVKTSPIAIAIEPEGEDLVLGHYQEGAGGCRKGCARADSNSRLATFRVLSSADIVEQITAFQPGRRYRDWRSGDKAVAMGHYPLLFTKERERIAARGPSNHISASHLQSRTLLYYTPNSLGLAVKAGNLELLQWLYQHPFADERDFLMSFCDLTKCEKPEESRNIYVAYDEAVNSRTAKLWDLAVKHQQMHILEWLSNQSPVPMHTSKAYDVAAASGHLEVLQWLCEKKAPGQDRFGLRALFYKAASSGQLKVMQWLEERYKPLAGIEDRWDLAPVIQSCQMETILWMQKTYGARNPICDPAEVHEAREALRHLAARGRVDFLDWLFRHPLYSRQSLIHKSPRHIINAAVKSGQFEVIEWVEKMWEKRLEKLVDVNGLALWYCWLRDGVPRKARLRLLQWLHQRYPRRRAKWRENLVSSAFKERAIDVLQWLHGLQSLPDDSFFSHVKVKSLLEKPGGEDGVNLLHWLHEVRPQVFHSIALNEVPISDITIYNPSFKVLSCVTQVFGPQLTRQVELDSALRAASKRGLLGMITHLQQHLESGQPTRMGHTRAQFDEENSLNTNAEKKNYDWRAKVVAAAVPRKDSRSLELLYQLGYNVHGLEEKPILRAVRRGRLDVLSFLHSKGALEVTEKVLDLALSLRLWDVLHWLARSASPDVYSKWLATSSLKVGPLKKKRPPGSLAVLIGAEEDEGFGSDDDRPWILYSDEEDVM